MERTARRARPGRPAVPDAQIVDGARQALIADPQASMAEIARAAGVGMSALYARFPNREALLRRFAADANADYQRALDRAMDRLAAGWTSRRALRELMVDIVVADVHPMLLAVWGTFERTQDDIEHSTRLGDMGLALIRRCHDDGVLRPGVTWPDVLKAEDMLAAVRGATDVSTRALRLRLLDVVFTGLTAGRRALPGDPPTVEDYRANPLGRRPPRASSV